MSRSDSPVGVAAVASSVLLALALVVGGVIWASAGTEESQTADGTTIVMGDYTFGPDDLTWTVGETVTITVENRSSSQPGKPHEVMFGRVPIKEPGTFGPVQGDGYEEQLLDGVTIELIEGNDVSMVMADTSTLTGADPMSFSSDDMNMGGMDMGGMDMGEGEEMRMGMDFMVVVDPGGAMTFRFEVPDRPGEWELGCFQQDGQHYLNDMKGNITVVSA